MHYIGTYEMVGIVSICDRLFAPKKMQMQFFRTICRITEKQFMVFDDHQHVKYLYTLVQQPQLTGINIRLSRGY